MEHILLKKPTAGSLPSKNNSSHLVPYEGPSHYAQQPANCTYPIQMNHSYTLLSP